ncbi:hypothetical protein JCM24511_02459 [Saitozyma sp. JCM 24511]|nr:hypothetical protein JCM24511_02459 [Saitozyma sp. JCM 24511]
MPTPITQHERDHPVETDDPLSRTMSQRDSSHGPGALTTVSSSATLVHLVESHDMEDISHQPTIFEAPAPPPSAPNPNPAPPTTGPRGGAAAIDRPPPVHPPDIIAFFDPASAGGGGPLKRITTQQRERAEAEARERAEREAQGLPPDGGILHRFRSGSTSSRRAKPRFVTPLTVDEEHPATLPKFRPNLSPTLSSKTLAQTPGKEEGEFNLAGSEEKDKEANAAPVVDEESQQVTLDNEYPDGGYGWVVLICCLTWAGTTMGWGMNYGVFQQYYLEYVWPDTNTAYLSIVGSSCAFFMNIIAFISGRMGDRFGFKLVLYLSAFVSWLGLFLAGFSNEVWQLLLTQGIIAGIGQGMAMPLFMSLPSQWFYRRRGFASGVAIGGAGIGGGVSTLLVRKLLTVVGYRKTLWIMSGINLGVSLLATFLIRTRPTSREAQSTGKGPWVDRRVIRSGKFWSLGLSLIIGVLGYGIPFIYITQWITTTIPDTPSILIAVPTTLLGFSVCIGRAVVGFVADRLGPVNTYILVFILSGCVQFLFWLTAKNFAAICAFAVIYGICAPGYVGLVPQIVVQLFGPENLATNVGLILLFNGPGNFVGSPMAGAVFDATGRHTFTWVIVLGGMLQIMGGIIALWARFHISAKIRTKV